MCRGGGLVCILGPVGLRGGLALKCLGGPFGKKSLGLLIGDMPLIRPGPILGCPPAMCSDLRGGLALMGGTRGVGVVTSFLFASLTLATLVVITRGVGIFNNFDFSKLDFWTSDLLDRRAFSSVIISSFFRIAVHSSEATLLQIVSVIEVVNHGGVFPGFKCCGIDAVIDWLVE